MNSGETFSPDFPCQDCNGLGELSHSRGHQGFICEACNGTGAKPCGFCRQPATDVVDGNYACLDCLPLTVSEVCWQCMGDVPVAMHGGLALCGRCWEDARKTEPPPPAHDTWPCLVQCDQAAAETLPETAANDRTPLLLAESLELIEDARAAGVEPREAFAIVRNARAKRAGRMGA